MSFQHPVREKLRVIPVLHFITAAAVLEDAQLANAAGAAGVALIDMSGYDELLDPVAVEIKTAFPRLLVGTNRLRTPKAEAIKQDVALGLDFTWCDDPGIRGDDSGPLGGACDPNIAEAVTTAKRQRAEQDQIYRYFASVGFKTHRPQDRHPTRAALLAELYGFVPVTSGPATGIAPDIAKLMQMRAPAKGTALRALGVASGVTPDNAHDIVPHVDWIFVATGISHDGDRINPAKLDALMTIARAENAAR